MSKAKKPAPDPEKTRRGQIWEIVEGPRAGTLALYYPDLQTYDVKVQNAVLLFPYDKHNPRLKANPFLQRVGTRGFIKKEFYE